MIPSWTSSAFGPNNKLWRPSSILGVSTRRSTTVISSFLKRYKPIGVCDETATDVAGEVLDVLTTFSVVSTTVEVPVDIGGELTSSPPQLMKTEIADIPHAEAKRNNPIMSNNTTVQNQSHGTKVSKSEAIYSTNRNEQTS
jgi:hypothetical protein